MLNCVCVFLYLWNCATYMLCKSNLNGKYLVLFVDQVSWYLQVTSIALDCSHIARFCNNLYRIWSKIISYSKYCITVRYNSPIPAILVGWCSFFNKALIKYSWVSLCGAFVLNHYNDVIMSAMASQTTGVSTVCSSVCSGADQRKHQSSASVAFMRGIHRWPVDYPHKRPVTLKMFPFDDVIMFTVKSPHNSIFIAKYAQWKCH